MIVLTRFPSNYRDIWARTVAFDYRSLKFDERSHKKLGMQIGNFAGTFLELMERR
jgi:hypothetical protein